jgi:hypothetical protein
MPTALFPSQIATDAQLKVAANLIETKLRIAINATDTVLFVASTVGFAPDMLVSIDKEIISIAGVMPAPDSTLQVATSGRGFDGTTATTHAAGAKVSILIDAWHHNALSAEVKAIQTALGPNLANISPSGINSSIYNFNPQQPGGSLIVGNNNITLAPVPQGVNGTNTDHWLYISGGTGAAEAVLITGGTAISGEPSGTVIVNCGNAHSGAWTIQSATAGIQEALQMVPANGAEIHIPAGPQTIYAPITVAIEGTRISGTTCNPNSGLVRTTGIVFNVTAGTVDISNLAIWGGGGGGIGAPAGNIGIRSVGPRCHYYNLMLNLLYGGVDNAGGFHSVYEDIWARNLSGYVCKHSGGVSPFFSKITYDTDSPGYDVSAEGGIIINASGAYVYDVDILHCHHGIVVQPMNARLEWTFIYDARFDQNYTYGIYILNGTVHAIDGVFLHDIWSASAGMTGTFSGVPPTTGSGIMIENPGGGAGGTIKNVQLHGGQIFNNCDQNLQIHAGHNITISDTYFGWCNSGDGANIDNIYVGTPGRVEITESLIASNLAGGAALRSGILAGGSTGDLLIRNCRFDTDNGTYASGPIVNLASSPGAVKTDGVNRGSDDIPQEGVPSAATLNLAPRQYHHVTGTATINNIMPTWQGRTVYLFKPDAGAWTITTAGNVSAAFTVNAGENIILEFTGNKWIGRK